MLNIAKEKENALLVIQKKGIRTDQKMAVTLNLDVSGSARPLFNSGKIQRLLEGVIPLALNFDDNGSLQVFTFASGDEYVTEISPEVTANNFEGYIEKNILNNSKVNKWGCTSYSEVIRENLVNLGYIINERKGGLFGFGGGSEQKFRSRNGSGYPSFVITFTDGRNDDQGKIKALLKECQDNKINAYFLFVGVGSKDEFRNIEVLGESFSNVGFVGAEDIDEFLNKGDVYDKLLPEELVEWLKQS